MNKARVNGQFQKKVGRDHRQPDDEHDAGIIEVN